MTISLEFSLSRILLQKFVGTIRKLQSFEQNYSGKCRLLEFDLTSIIFCCFAFLFMLNIFWFLYIKMMYFPFLQNDFNSYYYYCNNTVKIEAQYDEKPIECLQQPISPTESPKIEEKDAEDIDSYNMGNISITGKELTRAGYEKSKQPWNEQEDSRLLMLVGQKLKWMQIASEMKGRSIKMCYSRFKRLEKKANDKRGFWTSQEDKRLIELVNQYGQNWKELSIYFENRKPKQLRERYINALTPNISKDPWTLQQDLKLIELYNMFGKKWKSIAEQLYCRSENQVKNRFYGRILPLEIRKSKNS